jgi:serine/threonine protein kinase/tetratricopeptide (TPR) repeat protein
MNSAADRHLLFGLLALQTGVINQSQLVSAFQAWALDKSQTLADHLEARGDLNRAKRTLLEALTELHVESHGGDVDRSLAAVSAGKSTREDLALIGEPSLEATLDIVGSAERSAEDGQFDLSPTYTVGTTTSDGQRFRVLRPHARGGLGAIFVALDGELNREVAVKQILDHQADDPVSRQRFLLEAEITGGLEHPGIVPVYGLGTYADGRPYYAMRFIRGDSLKEAIGAFHQRADAKSRAGLPGESTRKATDKASADLGGGHGVFTPETSGGQSEGNQSAVQSPYTGKGSAPSRDLALRKLLRRFTDVCNAIDYAHSRGILHRDIKPGNIIVGKHGETLVVDWGLAKPLGRAEPSREMGERTLMPSSASGSADTLPGTTLGTPSYMSPEQAAGNLEHLGPRSDVYSLGATLYCVLTGKPPFESEDVGNVLQKVQRGDFPSPRQLDPSLDKSLEAVCLKAMANKPDDRYASCRALAEDVERWMADEPVSARRDTWPDQLTRWARRHRAWAQAAVAALLAVAIVASVAALLVDSARRAEMVARHDATQSLAAERVAKAAAAANLDQANANLRLARQAVEEYFTRVSQDTLLKRQDAPNVRDLRELRKDLLDVALRYYQQFVDQHQEDSELQHELAQAYGRVGELTGEIGSKERALEAHQHELSIWTKLAAAAPDDSKAQSSLGASHYHVGMIERQLGRTALALASYERALAIWERLAAEHPDIPAQENLGRALTARGNVLSDLGRLDDAMASYQRSLEVYQRIAATSPANPAYQDRLASAYNSIAVAEIGARHVDQALAAFERAREIRERVVAARPTVVQYQKNLAMAYKNIALLMSETNRPAEALAAYERARAIRSRLVAANPTVSQLQYDLALTLLEMGIHRRATGDPDKALAHYAETEAILTRLVADNPSVSNYQDKLAAVWHNTANIFAASGRYDEALAGYERARAAQAKLVAAESDRPEHRHTLGTMNTEIGACLFDAGRLDAALVAAERGRGILEALVAEQPNVPEYRRNLANNLNTVGAVHLSRTRLDQALAALEQARAIRLRLVNDSPAVLQYQLDLAESTFNVGSLKARQQHLSEALEFYEQAQAELVKLAESDPSHAAVRRSLAAVHNGIAGVRSVVGPKQEALASAERARALLEPVPHLLADDLYELALSHVLASGLASPEPLAGNGEDRMRRESHADQAISLLRHAIESGYRKRTALETDPGWQPIRQRTDFQTLLRDIAWPADPFAR